MSVKFAHAAESVSSVAQKPEASYDNRVRDRVRATAVEQLRWLPAAQRSRVLGDSGEKVQVEFAEVEGSSVVRVALGFDLPGLFPSLALPLVGTVPPLPPSLQAQASARL